MANLRELLGTEFKSTLDLNGQVPKNLHTGKIFIFRDQHECVEWECGYEGHGRKWLFCTPKGTSCITFEAWGGGGGSPSACQCSIATPGSTGAYVRKTMPAFAGTCYCICVAGHRGAPNAVTEKRGCHACWSAICGPNVTICAPGGYGGGAFCNIMKADDANNEYIDEDIIDLTSEAAALSYDCWNCGPTGYANDHPGHTNEFIRGRASQIRYHCSHNRAIKFLVPFPPRLTNDQGGWVTYSQCDNCACATPRMHHTMGAFTAGTSYGAHDELPGNIGVPGFPGLGSASNGTCCIHGTMSSSGFIRITAFTDEKCMDDCCTNWTHMCQ